MAGNGRPTKLQQQERRRYVAALLRKGLPYSDVFRLTTGEWECTRQTVSRDIVALGKTWTELQEDADALGCEIQAAVERIKRRAAEGPPHVAQRADEALLKLFGEKMAAIRLYALGVKVDRQQARLAELEVETAEAQLDLARARARLASTQAEGGGALTLLVGELPDLAGAMEPADLEQLTPTPLEDTDGAE